MGLIVSFYATALVLAGAPPRSRYHGQGHPVGSSYRPQHFQYPEREYGPHQQAPRKRGSRQKRAPQRSSYSGYELEYGHEQYGYGQDFSHGYDYTPPPPMKIWPTKYGHNGNRRSRNVRDLEHGYRPQQQAPRKRGSRQKRAPQRSSYGQTQQDKQSRLSLEELTELKFMMYGWLKKQQESSEMAFSDITGEVLRLVGHDFMSDYELDGCLDMSHVENAGLEYAIGLANTCLLEVCQDKLSLADCTVVLSEAIMDYTVEKVRPGLSQRSILDTPYPVSKNVCESEEEDHECIWLNAMDMPGVLDFETAYGRTTKDMGSCKSGTLRDLIGHPKEGAGGPPPGLADTLSFDLLLQVLGGGEHGEACGFTEDDVVAIMGIHTIGHAETENSGFQGTWVSQEIGPGYCVDQDSGCEPSLFNNQYYKDFFRMGWRKKADGKGWECVPGSNGVDISTLDEELPPDTNHYGTLASDTNACFADSLRLSADMIIMYDLSPLDDECLWEEVSPGVVHSTCTLRPEWAEVLEYALSDEEWLVAFIIAWKKMVDCNHDNLWDLPYNSEQTRKVRAVAETFYRRNTRDGFGSGWA